MTKPTCVLLTTDKDIFSGPAEKFARQCFDVRLVSRHSWGNARLTDDIVSVMGTKEVDYLFSYLCPVVVPLHILQKTRKLNINIHPAPPEYPGVGSASRALYDRKTMFGVTAHVMEEKLDNGRILMTRSFPIHDADTCETLDHRARTIAMSLFEEVMTKCSMNAEFPPTAEKWKNEFMTRKGFREWMTLPPDASREEVERKVNALRHSSLPGPYIKVHGHLFGYRGMQA